MNVIDEKKSSDVELDVPYLARHADVTAFMLSIAQVIELVNVAFSENGKAIRVGRRTRDENGIITTHTSWHEVDAFDKDHVFIDYV